MYMMGYRQTHCALLQKQEGQAKYADAVLLNRDNNNQTVRASFPVACPVQHEAAS